MDKYQPINVLSPIGVHNFVILTTVTVYLQLLLIRITYNQFIHVYFINLPKICILKCHAFTVGLLKSQFSMK